MGSIAYDFLADSILFDEKEIQRGFPSLSEGQIENLLQDYRTHCINNIEALKSDVIDNKSSLKVLSSTESVNFRMLKHSSLYFDQFIIYDPIFRLTRESTGDVEAMSKALGFKGGGISKKELIEAAVLLKRITPMVAGNYIKVLPLSYVFEPPKQIPINLPVNYYADSLPKELMEYCREKAIVKSMKQVDGGWQIMDQQDLTPGLFINFEGYEQKQGLIYNYMNQEITPTEDPNKFLTKMTLAEYPLAKNVWDTWVFQSINASAKAVVHDVYTENILTQELKATYLTDNEFTANMLIRNLSAKETVETASATQFMNLELPFLDKIDIDKLMAIRTNEAEIFTNFRIELERQFRELRTITDPQELKLRQENILHELGTVQVQKIGQKLDSLKRKGFAEGVMAIGGLAGTVQTAGWSLIASALACASGYKTYREYKDSLAENPSYLLWKVLKK